MTRRDFEKLAAVLAAELIATRHTAPSSHATVRRLTHSLADLCASENPRFDRDRFYAAAGLEEL